MFLVNGEPLNEITHPKEYAWMHKKFEELKNLGKKSFNFSAFDKRSTDLRNDGRIVPQKDRRRLVSMVGFTSEPTGLHQTWSYATSMSALKPDGSGAYLLRRGTFAMEYNTIFSIERDIELIFFLMFISKNKNIKLIDYEAKNKARAEMIALRSKAESLVYSSDSPIHPAVEGSDVKLKNLALAWGVSGALSMDYYTVMSQLWTKIQGSQDNYRITKRGYAEFIDEVKAYGGTGKRATVVLAIEKSILQYSDNTWKLISNGGIEQFLCGVPFQDEKHKDDYVMKYVLDNNLIYEALEATLNEPSVSQNKLSNEKQNKRYELLSKARDLGWTGTFYKTVAKMNKEELEELILEQRKPEIQLEK